jgi:predicted secreted protein
MAPLTTRVGESFSVVLEELPSSGHTWSCRDPPNSIHLVAIEPVGAASPEIGTPSRKRFTFVATEAGGFTVTFVLKRPWEPEPVEERKVRVLVAAERM